MSDDLWENQRTSLTAMFVVVVVVVVTSDELREYQHVAHTHTCLFVVVPSDELREHQHMYERLVEGERGVDLARADVDSHDARLAKLEKELKKSIKRGTVVETQTLRDKIDDVEAKQAAALHQGRVALLLRVV